MKRFTSSLIYDWLLSSIGLQGTYVAAVFQAADAKHPVDSYLPRFGLMIFFVDIVTIMHRQRLLVL